eukprot:TRINITY_DN32539_c0_g1_i1.p1 TRINITY_DN32539_c0_g1~~TRINITY_DN32539_c0_g1_i1.p1  ORF type:complete len:201 (+),score=45.27 TRINITY_DN32539_c0_g1_i1:155-757(+)
MLRSLVGSEMCIRDSRSTAQQRRGGDLRDRRLARALLQLVLREHAPCLLEATRGAKLPTAQVRDGRGFGEYVHSAVAVLGGCSEQTSSVLGDTARLEALFAASRESESSGLAGWFCMRQALATVVESLILMDRMLFLADQPGISSVLLPVFDPDISPRNRCIVALRDSWWTLGPGAVAEDSQDAAPVSYTHLTLPTKRIV